MVAVLVAGDRIPGLAIGREGAAIGGMGDLVEWITRLFDDCRARAPVGVVLEIDRAETPFGDDLARTCNRLRKSRPLTIWGSSLLPGGRAAPPRKCAGLGTPECVGRRPFASASPGTLSLDRRQSFANEMDRVSCGGGSVPQGTVPTDRPSVFYAGRISIYATNRPLSHDHLRRLLTTRSNRSLIALSIATALRPGRGRPRRRYTPSRTQPSWQTPSHRAPRPSQRPPWLPLPSRPGAGVAA